MNAGARLGPIRTALFVPGDRPERIEKAIASEADAVIIDLEDAVSAEHKAEARAHAREALMKHRRRRLIVRVNSLSSGLLKDDLESMMVPSLKTIMAPKVDSPSDAKQLFDYIIEAEAKTGMTAGQVAVVPLIESALAVENTYLLFADQPEPRRMTTAAFGAADYALDMGIEITLDGAELNYPRSRITVACRAAGMLAPLDTPFMLDIADEQALRRDALRAKQLGFGGKLCVHPRQVRPCNEVFSPSEERLEWARTTVAAFETARMQGVGAVQSEGRFIDHPVAERARRILELAEQDTNPEE